MQRLSAETRQAFARKVILPIVGFLVGLFLIAVVGVMWVASYQTRTAMEEQTRLADGALRIFAEELGVSAADYGSWDDAVTAIVDKPDPGWLHDYVGQAAEENLGVAMAFVLDPQGRPVYSYVESTSGTANPATYLGSTFAGAFENWQQRSPDAAYSTLVAYDNMAVALAIAPVRYFNRPDIPPTGYSIVLVKFVDAAQIKKIARNFDLANFHAVTADGAADDGARVAAGDPTAGDVVHFAWDPRRPGDGLLRIALPFMGLSIVVLLLLAGVVFNYVIASAQLLRDREMKAFRDPLTGLANRARLFQDLNLAVNDRRGKYPSNLAVMYIDLDRFKEVNDTKGHAAGDELLVQAANRFRACVGESDTVARLGGDEFAIVMMGRRSTDEIRAVGASILSTMSEPFDLSAGTAHVSCSIGVAVNSQGRTRAADLLELADRALYQVKAAGRNALRFVDETSQAALTAV